MRAGEHGYEGRAACFGERAIQGERTGGQVSDRGGVPAATGYHRKHAMRMLRAGPSSTRSAPRPSRRIYGAAEREALIVLWEASDRVCGKRLKAIIPTLIEAMVRHGHLALASEVRAALLKISAATMDRALQPQRERCSTRRRRLVACTT